MRGDRPSRARALQNQGRLPRMRIDRSCITPLVTMPRLPRMRGDRPLFFPLPRPTRMFTPHARGSTGVKMGKFGVVGVYPACAGIDRVHTSMGERYGSLPRMRGDRPWEIDVIPIEEGFTPHARGSTLYPNDLALYITCIAGIDHSRRDCSI